MFKHKQDFKLFQLESKSLEKQKLKLEDNKSSFLSHKLEASTKSQSQLSKSSLCAIPELPANGAVFRSDKAEYDLKPEEIEDVEALTNSKIICNIGYGGFSTVKLIFSFSQKIYYAMKVVSKLFTIFILSP